MIENDRNNIIIKALSRALETDINFLCLALIVGKSSSNSKLQEESQVVILMGKEKLFILTEDFKTIKLQIEYASITQVYLDSEVIYSLIINIDKSKLSSNVKIDTLTISVKDRSAFIKSLICYHSIYYMEMEGVVSELQIKSKNFKMDVREDSLITKGQEMIHNEPESFIKMNKFGAE